MEKQRTSGTSLVVVVVGVVGFGDDLQAELSER
jgi:hypothetical protein